MKQKKILLAHLNARGDSLYSTVIARQVKEVDFKGCHLTWAINSKCKETILLNPFIDHIWEVPVLPGQTREDEWHNFVKDAEQRKTNGEFDVVFYLQIIAENMLNYDGGIRSSTYNNYPYKVTVPQKPIIRLSDEEVDFVKEFAAQHKLHSYKNVILMECGPENFSSNLNINSGLILAEKLVTKYESTAVIISSNKKISSTYPSIIDGSVVSFRANAELTKYCTLFIGCSSGISWLSTTDWAKPLPKMIITDYTIKICSSMIYDHEYAGLNADDIIEFQENKMVMEKMLDCAQIILSENFAAAKNKYRKPARLKNLSFVYWVGKEGFFRGDMNSPAKVFKRAIKRNGFRIEAVFYLLKAYIKLPIYLIQMAFKSLFPKNKKS